MLINIKNYININQKLIKIIKNKKEIEIIQNDKL